LGINLAPLQAQDRAVQINILPTGEIGMEPGPQFDQSGHAASGPNLATRGKSDFGQQLEDGALSRAIVADDAQHFALLHCEAHVFERPKQLRVRRLAIAREQSASQAGEGLS
jgi:hypothetical protein